MKCNNCVHAYNPPQLDGSGRLKPLCCVVHDNQVCVFLKGKDGMMATHAGCMKWEEKGMKGKADLK